MCCYSIDRIDLKEMLTFLIFVSFLLFVHVNFFVCASAKYMENGHNYIKQILVRQFERI